MVLLIVEIFRFCIIFIILSISCISDIKTNKIWNSLVIIGWALACVLSFVSALVNKEGVLIGIRNIGLVIGSSFFVLVIGFLFYKYLMFGAGDVKLYSVIAGFYGIKVSAIVFMMMLCLTGVYGVFKIIKRKKNKSGEMTKIILAPFTLIAFVVFIQIKSTGIIIC